MHVVVRAIEQQLAGFEPGAFVEHQPRGFAGKPRHVAIEDVIVAPIARAEVTSGEEGEIMVMRQVVEERRGAAGLHHRIVARRPEIGA